MTLLTLPSVPLPPITVPVDTVLPPDFEVPLVCKFGPGPWDLKTSSSVTHFVPGGTITVTATPCIAFRGETFRYTASIDAPIQARFANAENYTIDFALFGYDTYDTGWELTSAPWTCGGPVFVPESQPTPSQVWSASTAYHGTTTGFGLHTANVKVQYWWLHYVETTMNSPDKYMCFEDEQPIFTIDVPVVVIDADRPPGFPLE